MGIARWRRVLRITSSIILCDLPSSLFNSAQGLSALSQRWHITLSSLYSLMQPHHIIASAVREQPRHPNLCSIRQACRGVSHGVTDGMGRDELRILLHVTTIPSSYGATQCCADHGSPPSHTAATQRMYLYDRASEQAIVSIATQLQLPL